MMFQYYYNIVCYIPSIIILWGTYITINNNYIHNNYNNNSIIFVHAADEANRITAYNSTSNISEQCLTDMDIIRDIILYDVNYTRLYYCPIDLEISNMCFLDYNSSILEGYKTQSGEYEQNLYNRVQIVNDTCTKLGYQFIFQTIIADCAILSYTPQVDYEIRYVYLNYPYCYGPTCTEDEFQEYFKTKQYAIFHEQLLHINDTVGSKATCTFSNGHTIQYTSTTATTLLIIISTLSVILW